MLDDIYHLVGRPYGKHLNDISSITSRLGRDDYSCLLEANRCNLFEEFVEDLVSV